MPNRRFLSPKVLSLMVAVMLCVLAPAAAHSQQASVPTSGTVAKSHEVREWLLRIHQAANHRNFQGTFVVSGGGTVASARIAHFCEGSNQLERSETLDGQPRLVYRNNDVVTTVWPMRKVALIEQRTQLAEFPALLQAGDDGIADFYELHSQGSERVAGHEANVLFIRPRDDLRYGYRLWADQASGLLLRSDVLGGHGEVLESSTFSDVAINVKSAPETVLQPMKHLEGLRIVRPVLTPTSLEAQGWLMRSTPSGFRQVSCVKRLIGAEPAFEKDEEQPVLQSIYSDGLTYVSIFIEPFDAKRRLHPMLASVGPTQTLMHQQGDWWVTVVGDVPATTLRQFAQGLERAEPSKKQ